MAGLRVFDSILAPLIGNILALAMIVSPIPAVWRVRLSGDMGPLNPYPYPMTLINSIGWLVYGLLIQNAWILPGSAAGALLGLYFSLQVMPFISRKSQDIFMWLLVGSTAYFCLLGAISAMVLDEDTRNSMWGIQSVVTLFFFYGMPLSSMIEVIKTRNAASIYIPLAIAGVLNGTMWTCYGLFAAHDFNIWMPNLVGAALSVLQLGLRFGYGVKPANSDLGAPQRSINSPLYVDADGHRELREGSDASEVAPKASAAKPGAQLPPLPPAGQPIPAVPPTTVVLG